MKTIHKFITEALENYEIYDIRDAELANRRRDELIQSKHKFDELVHISTTFKRFPLRLVGIRVPETQLVVAKERIRLAQLLFNSAHNKVTDAKRETSGLPTDEELFDLFRPLNGA